MPTYNPCVIEELEPGAGDRLVVVTGLSGAGKSQAVRGLESLGYRCTDNLPPALLPALRDANRRSGSPRPLAVVIDARSTGPDDIPGLLAGLRDDPAATVIYLEASDAALARRFSETRKVHPLDEGSGLESAVATERLLLADLRDAATVVDTSTMRVDALVRRVQELAGARTDGGLPVTVSSFGFKYGVPVDADWVVDARFLENPFYDPELRALSGLDEPIRRFVFGSPLTEPFLDGVARLLDGLLAGYRDNGKPSLAIAVGCTGGRHRSVVLAEELGRRLQDEAGGVTVVVRHRDLQR